MDDGLFIEYHLTIKQILLLRRAGKPISRGARHHSDGRFGGVLHSM